jgi:hypothetical protein
VTTIAHEGGTDAGKSLTIQPPKGCVSTKPAIPATLAKAALRSLQLQSRRAILAIG